MESVISRVDRTQQNPSLLTTETTVDESRGRNFNLWFDGKKKEEKEEEREFDEKEMVLTRFDLSMAAKLCTFD